MCVPSGALFFFCVLLLPSTMPDTMPLPSCPHWEQDYCRFYAMPATTYAVPTQFRHSFFCLGRTMTYYTVLALWTLYTDRTDRSHLVPTTLTDYFCITPDSALPPTFYWTYYYTQTYTYRSIPCLGGGDSCYPSSPSTGTFYL